MRNMQRQCYYLVILNLFLRLICKDNVNTLPFTIQFILKLILFFFLRGGVFNLKHGVCNKVSGLQSLFIIRPKEKHNANQKSFSRVTLRGDWITSCSDDLIKAPLEGIRVNMS